MKWKVSVGFSLILSCTLNAELNCGSQIDSYKGVPALYNGSNALESCGNNGNKGRDGFQWQCVEYIRRFYRLAKGIDSTQWNGKGDAKDYVPSAKLFGLSAFLNDGTATEPPQPDDIIGFDKVVGNKFGHVAIVKEVLDDGGSRFSVKLIEQNWGVNVMLPVERRTDGQGGFIYTMPKREKYRIQGWLRPHHAVADFSTSGNPHGPWSYGYRNGLAGVFNLYTIVQPNFLLGLDRWAAPSVDLNLGVARNRTTIPIAGSTFDYPPDMLHMHPAPPNRYDVVRWTAPISGLFSTQGKFAGLDRALGVADTDVHIRVNNQTSLWSTVLQGLGTEAPFTIFRALNAGDTVDFAVGVGPSGAHQNDSTGLKATITQVASSSVRLWVGNPDFNNIARFDANTRSFVDALSGSSLMTPQQMIIGPDGNVYVADSRTNTVIRFSGGTGAVMGPFMPIGSVNRPIGVAFDRNNNLLVTSLDNLILKFHGSTGAAMGVFASGGGLNTPSSITFGPDGNLYVSNDLGHSILRFSGATGAFMGAFVPSGSGGLVRPQGLIFGPDSNLYVASGSNQVLKYSGSTGVFLGVFAGTNIQNPLGIVFGPDGKLYVSNLGVNNINAKTITRYDPNTGAFVDYFMNGDSHIANNHYILFR